MAKVAIHPNFGGFDLPAEADRWLEDQGFTESYRHGKGRSDPRLLEAVRRWGGREIIVIDVPDDVKWHIEEYDGREWVAEDHRTWGRDCVVDPIPACGD